MDRQGFAKNSAIDLLPKHGGYRKLKSFQIAQLAYDVTVRFCEAYISKKSRTHDQMVQAARSGVQNIAEGSQASGTSKKTELKLTNVARASLEELKLDYEDFLRQKELPLWHKDDPRRKELVMNRCQTAQQVADWVKKVHDEQRRQGANVQDRLKGQGANGQDRLNGHNGQDGQAQETISAQPSIESMSSMPSIPLEQPASQPLESYATIAANAALVLIGVANALLDRQIQTLADTFIKEGGFTEKLYKTRISTRNK